LWPRRSVLFRDIQKPVEKGAIAKKLPVTELLRKKIRDNEPSNG
jgi:hypothetical protein